MLVLKMGQLLDKKLLNIPMSYNNGLELATNINLFSKLPHSEKI
jgi:hypothetical protein